MYNVLNLNTPSKCVLINFLSIYIPGLCFTAVGSSQANGKFMCVRVRVRARAGGKFKVKVI